MESLERNEETASRRTRRGNDRGEFQREDLISAELGIDGRSRTLAYARQN